jgi:hypothetical protein
MTIANANYREGVALSADGAVYVSLASGTSPVLAGDGTVAAPSYSFASEPGLGAYRSSAGVMDIVAGGGLSARFQNGYLVAGTNLIIGVSGDVILTRAASGVLALINGNAAQEFRVSAGNGSYAGFITVNESLTIAAAATTDSATTIPANAVILSCAVRVTTVIPTASTFTVTTATGGTTMNTAAVSVAANSTDVGTKAGHFFQSAATKVRITPSLTPGAATGVVRLCITYYLPTAPTS